MKFIIHFARGLLCVTAAIILGTVSAADILIWPDVPELTLTSGADLTLKCTGDVPVKLKQQQYDPSLYTEKNSSINISQGLVNGSYISLLSLSRASYLDTGYFFCDPLTEDLEVDEQNSAKIYLFVQHDTHLLAVPENLVLLSQDEFGNVIIPCRPTSPDINVTLTKDGEELVPDNTYDGMELLYDLKLGFLLYSVTMFSSGIYSCHAEYHEKKSYATYHIVIMRKTF